MLCLEFIFTKKLTIVNQPDVVRVCVTDSWKNKDRPRVTLTKMLIGCWLLVANVLRILRSNNFIDVCNLYRNEVGMGQFTDPEKNDK